MVSGQFHPISSRIKSLLSIVEFRHKKYVKRKVLLSIVERGAAGASI